jgi:HK97 family phage prohead protease
MASRDVYLKGSRMQSFAIADAETDTATRTLTGLAVPWNTVTQRFGTDVQFTRDTLRVPEQLNTVKLLVQHDQDLPVGYAVNAVFADDGLRMTFQLADHPRADALLAETDALLRDGLSVGVELDAEVIDEAIDRMWGDSDSSEPLAMAGTVREVSSVSIPQFNDARINQAAGLVTFTSPTTEGTTMPPTAPPAAPAPAVPVIEDAPTFSIEELAEQLQPYLERQAKDPHRFAAFLSLADYYEQAFDGTVEKFALVDQITTDNPGVVPPSWLSEIQGIIDADRPSIAALGSTPAPASGTEVNWPVWTGDIKTLVGEQLTEKSEIVSVKVSFGKAGATLKTYAGGSDISYQLLKRSTPEYRAAYMELLLSGYNYVTDFVFITAVVAAATVATIAWDPATGSTSDLRHALFSASMQVRTATGQPASIVIASDDVFLAIAGLDGLYPAPYGTNNAGGTVDASNLEIKVAGLPPIVNDPFAPAGTLVVTNSRGAKWIEDGPYTATAEDVAKLGQDNAIWGMGAPGLFNPKGVIKIDDGVVVADEEDAEPTGRGRRRTTSPDK